VKLPGEDPGFSLTSTYVPISRQNLAGFVGVNSDPESPHYGRITVLQLPTDNTIAGPTLAENTFNANTKVSAALLPYKSNNSNAQARLGNLLTLPLDKQMLYVQPVYTEQGGEVTYPILQFVIVSINKRVGIGSDFSDAINSALQLSAAKPTPPPSQGNKPGGPNQGKQTVEHRINTYVDNARSELEAAQKALHSGDLGQYQAHNKAALDWLQKAIDLRNQNPTAKPTKPAAKSKDGGP
jgi:uncharacterized protein